MGIAGKSVLTVGGEAALLPGGKFAIKNASGLCCDCCGKCEDTLGFEFSDNFASSPSGDWAVDSGVNFISSSGWGQFILTANATAKYAAVTRNLETICSTVSYSLTMRAGTPGSPGNAYTSARFTYGALNILARYNPQTDQVNGIDLATVHSNLVYIEFLVNMNAGTWQLICNGDVHQSGSLSFAPTCIDIVIRVGMSLGFGTMPSGAYSEFDDVVLTQSP